MKPDARFLALSILCQWQDSREPVDSLRDQWLVRYPQLDPRDVQLTQALLFGVLRRLEELDWLLARYAKHPLARMQVRTLMALRIGLFQLLHLDRVPASAAINQTVEAFKAERQPKWLVGFVNGMLRTMAREQDKIHALLAGPQVPQHIRLHHPEWLLARWRKRYGRERAAALCLADDQPAPLTLRVNTAKVRVEELSGLLTEQGVTVQPGRYLPEALSLPELRGGVGRLPGYKSGLFHVQDEAAQLASLLLGPFEQRRHLLDGCAGLGGKTLQMAALAPQASITALEPAQGRIRMLTANLTRLGLAERVRVEQNILEQHQPPKPGYDGILIDAPCSGLGVIRRHPDIRWNRSQADLKSNQTRQTALLSSAAPMLAPGGVLLYVVCSMEPEETEAVVDSFLAAHPDFQLTDPRPLLPPAAAELVGERGLFRTFPDLHGLDGFFAARVVKQ